MATTYYASTTGIDSNNGLSADAPKTLTGAVASAASGDTLMLADGIYPRLVINGKPSLVFRAHSAPTAEVVPGFTDGHPARRNRGVVIDTMVLRDSPFCDFHEIGFTLKQWIDVTAGGYTDLGGRWVTGFGENDPHGIIGQDAASHRPRFYSCEVSWGYGPTQAPFDTAAKYPEFQSGAYASSEHNATGWGDPYQPWWQPDDETSGAAPPANTLMPNGRAYNTIAEAPAGFYGHHNAQPGQFYACHFHDLQKAIVCYTNNGRPVIDQCWLERIYAIAIQSACDGGLHMDGLQTTRTIIEGFFNFGRDSGNPHGDIFQHFSAINDANPDLVIRHPKFRFERNFALTRPSDRGWAQFLFLQGGRSGTNPAIYENPLIRDNLAAQFGNNLGISPPIEDGVIDNNMCVTTPGLPAASRADISASRYPASFDPGKVALRNNVAEGIGAGSFISASGNVAVGQGFSAIPAAALMTGPFPPADVSSAGWYAALNRAGAFEGKGPRYETLAELVLAPLTTEDVALFVGWDAKTLLIPNQPDVTSGRSAIRGPEGATVSVSVDKGQFRITTRDGAIVTNWTSSVSDALVGQYLEMRHTSASLFDTAQVQTATLAHEGQGAAAFTFVSTTQSNISYPRVNLATGVMPTVTGRLAANSRKSTLAVRGRLTQYAAGNSYLFGDADAQTGMRARVIAMDNSAPWGANDSHKIRLEAFDDTGGVSIHVDNLDSQTPLDSTSTYLLIFSLDTALGTAGFSAAIWNLSLGGAPISFSNPTGIENLLIGWEKATGQHAKRSINSTYGTSPAPDLDFVFVKSGAFIDATSPVTAQKFSASLIGPNGEGVFGSPPDLFMVGNLGDWNSASGLNRGASALKPKITAGAATSVVAAAWPPVLQLTVEIQTPGPCLIGTPVDFLIFPKGYGKPLNVTPHSDKAGTWNSATATMPAGVNGLIMSFTPTEEGVHTFTFSNDGGYVNPAAETVEIIDPYIVIAPGSTVVLTRQEVLSLQAVTLDSPLGAYGDVVQITWADRRLNLTLEVV